jgi:hypothetical protein
MLKQRIDATNPSGNQPRIDPRVENKTDRHESTESKRKLVVIQPNLVKKPIGPEQP